MNQPNFRLLLLFLIAFIVNVASTAHGGAVEQLREGHCSLALRDYREAPPPVQDIDPAGPRDPADSPHKASHDCSGGHLHSMQTNEHTLVFCCLDFSSNPRDLLAPRSRAPEAPYRPPIS